MAGKKVIKIGIVTLNRLKYIWRLQVKRGETSAIFADWMGKIVQDCIEEMGINIYDENKIRLED